MSFFVNGIRQHSEQGHRKKEGPNTAAPAGTISVQLNSVLLSIGVIAMLLPAMYIRVLFKGPADAIQQEGEQVLRLSRNVCVNFNMFMICVLT